MARRRWIWIFAAVAVAVASYELWMRFLAPKDFVAAASLRIRLADAPPASTAAGEVVPDQFQKRVVDPEVIRLALSAVGHDANSHGVAGAGGVEDPARGARPTVTVGGAGERDVWEVRARVGSPERAVALANTVAEKAVSHLSRLLSTRRAALLDELRGRVSVAEQEWREATAAQLESSRKHGVTALTKREGLLRKLLVEAEEEIHGIEARRLALSHRIRQEAIHRNVILDGRALPGPEDAEPESRAPRDDGSARTPRSIRSASGDRSTAVSKEDITALEEELARARLENEVLLETLPAHHPRVAAVVDRIRSLERRIAALGESAEKTDTGADVSPALIEEYRSLGEAKVVAEKRRDHLFAELLRLQELQPELTAQRDRVESARRELDALRERIRLHESVSAAELATVQVESPAEHAERATLPGGEWAWRGGVAGCAFLLGLFLATALERVDTRFRSDHDVERLLRLPLLGVIPKVPRRELVDFGLGRADQRVVERFNAAGTVLRSVAGELDMKVFSVASANGGEGKTTVALNTAAALARKGLRVALVDADLRDPSAHEILGVNNDVGLSTYLDLEPTQEIVEGTPYDALDDEGRDDRVVEFLEETAIESLFILPSGPPCASPVAAIESPKMERMLADLRGIVDFVVIDTPAVMEAGEALTLAVLSDACLLVIGADRCEDSDALWIKHLLENVQTSIVGVFLNKASRGTMRKSVPGLEPSPEPRVPVGA